LSFVLHLRPPLPTPFPYTTLFRSDPVPKTIQLAVAGTNDPAILTRWYKAALRADNLADFLKENWELLEAKIIRGWKQEGEQVGRSEEHTSELQSRVDFVCRLLLEK